MYRILITSISALALGCSSKPNIFVLQDISDEKYYLSDSIKKEHKNGVIGNSPLIAIDGTEFNYETNLDTIVLPLRKSDIVNIGFLNKNSSHVIYGEKANNGAVIINTITLNGYGSDTNHLDQQQVKF